MKKQIRSVKRMVQRSRNPFQRRVETSSILSSANSQASLTEQIQWCEKLFNAIRSQSETKHDFDLTTGQLHWVRIKFILSLLERNPVWKANVSTTLCNVLEKTSGVELFTRTGPVQEGGLFSELADRLLKKVLPSPPRDHDLDDIFPRFFRSNNDARWVENLPTELTRQIISLLKFKRPDFQFSGVRRSMSEAILVLGEQVAFRGLSSDVRNRLPYPSVTHSPFLDLRRTAEELYASSGRSGTKTQSDLVVSIRACDDAIDFIYKELDRTGVSVGLVYSLECLRAALRRIESLAVVLGVDSSKADADLSLSTAFLAILIRDNLAARKLRPVVANSLKLLSQKVVERAAATGEHYVIQTRKQYREMLLAGLGGGAITVPTVLIKFAVTFAALPLFFEGLFVGLDYSLSFAAMQLLGFTLATKQPAMTGPALAGRMKKLKNSSERRQFVDEVARLTRSQFVAGIGNVFSVLPLAMLVDFVLRKASGNWFLTLEKAQYVIHSTHPFHTLTLFYAAWTGVILWFGGTSAGWAENWVVCRRLPEAIELNPTFQSTVGRAQAKRISKFFADNIGGFVGSFVLGFLMAFTPVFGKFFGIPLEVRHVTLASGSFGLALGPLVEHGGVFPWFDVSMAALGIFLVFLLNLSVSFSLAFIVAAKARGVHRRAIVLLGRRTLIHFGRHPLAFMFVVPERVETATKK